MQFCLPVNNKISVKIPQIIEAMQQALTTQNNPATNVPTERNVQSFKVKLNII